MKGFIEQVAERLYGEYGDEISSLNILFPNRRAQLFFVKALSNLTDRPIWQPNFTTIDEIMEHYSGLSAADPIRLIVELHNIYSKHHDENFDSFYFWGEMLLADFDSVDKYLIDADMLFTNISDLKEMEADLSYLTEEQREVIARFWRSLGKEAEFSDEKRLFIDIWQTLAPIYHEFRASLAEKSLAYTGMIHRVVAEQIKSGAEFKEESKDRFVVVGFNALTECEKELFDYLQKNHHVDFFWDYDRYYLDDREQEAGLFLRDNRIRYPQRVEIAHNYSSFSEEKKVTAVSAPSDSLQCKYVAEYLNQIMERTGKQPDKETAIVLTDENLLIPTLHSIPSEVENINVTMGYPLKLTASYTFIERLIELQSRKRIRHGRVMFYHSDVTGLLNHSLLSSVNPDLARERADEITKRQQIYIDSKHLRNLEQAGEGKNEPIFDLIFSGVDSWESLSDYLQEVIAEVIRHLMLQVDENIKGEQIQKVEFLAIVAESINKIKNTLEECDVELSMQMFASLMRKILQNQSIPYEGEPLQGVQVMGILETRCLDFENVLLLSVNDDTFPGNRAVSSSFIPYNLRFAYGLPTPQHHEGVYAYYFYRLLQRAENIHLVYSSRSDDRSSGEQSRYIYQLEYESPHEIVRKNMGLDVNHAMTEPILVEKKGEVWDKLTDFLFEKPQPEGVNRPRLSPTSFSNYLACPLKFYFYSIARLAPEEEVAEDIDAPMFGSILHKAMELLYRPVVEGDLNLKQYISSVLNSPEVLKVTTEAINEEFFHGENVPEEEYSGNLMLVRDIVIKYINTCVLRFDQQQEPFTIRELERAMVCEFKFKSTKGEALSVGFRGFADRVETLSDGTTRIVDYKTGRAKLDFRGVEAIFSDNFNHQNPAAVQTFIYAMTAYHDRGEDAQPALYYVRNLNEKGYSPLLQDKERKVEVRSYIDYKGEFEEKLSEKLTEMFDKKRAFIQCEDVRFCEWCDFRIICRR